jgi:hypothetical protein
MYVTLNLGLPQAAPVQFNLVMNNLYFLVSTGIIAVAITAVRHRLVVKQFLARRDVALVAIRRLAYRRAQRFSIDDKSGVVSAGNARGLSRVGIAITANTSAVVGEPFV